MALATTTQWEVRTTGTAGGVNGGGYNSSRAGATTDYSQQDTAHLTITDLVIDGADSSQVTSALTPFDSLDIGNILHITAGTNFTAGWYEVISVAGVIAVLDRSCGTVGSTGGTAYLGGAILFGTTLDNEFIDQLVEGNKVWIKSGTYTCVENISGGTGSTTTAPVHFIGYSSTRGDGPLDDTRPLINLTANYYWYTTTYDNFSNIIFNSARTTYGIRAAGANRLINCKFLNNSTTANNYACYFYVAGIIALGCEFVSYRGYGVYCGVVSCTFMFCYFHDSLYGIYHATNYVTIQNCLFDNCITTAFYQSVASMQIGSIVGNTFYGCENTLGTALLFSATNYGDLIYNNIFYGFVNAINHATAGSKAVLSNYNNYYNNDVDVVNVVKGALDIAADPDFSDVAQITGTTAITAATGKLVDTAKNFTDLGVVANRDCVYVVSGTGVTAGIYLITEISTTTNPNDTITCYCGATALSTNATADKVYQITTGHNFKIDNSGNQCINAGYPDTTTWMGGSKI